MRTILLSSAAALALISGANAADLPARPVSTATVSYSAPSWVGLYLGLNGGYGVSKGDQSIAGTNPNGVAAVSFGLVPNNLNTHGSGGLFGATVGYNFQFGQIVVGPEADFDWSGISGSDSQRLGFGPVALETDATSKLKWLATVRARAGYLITPATLLYATGGLALGGVESNTSVTLTAPGPFGASASANDSQTKAGWTIGAGVEEALASHWTLKAEYQYVDLGSIDHNFGTSIGGVIPVGFTSHQDFHFHTFKVGVNYRF